MTRSFGWFTAVLAGMAVVAATWLVGCGGDGGSAAKDTRRESYNQKVLAKHGKGLDDLPTVKLVAISPHNQDIQDEFEQLFSLEHALAHGQTVEIEWRNVGGSSQILEYLRNTYSNADTSGIDVAFGGGEMNFIRLAEEGMLEKMSMTDDARQAIPATFGGLEMYDPDGYWCGAALSGFGFLYNNKRLDKYSLQPPSQWEDLGDKRFYDMVALADPTKSGSATAAYEMVVQTEDNWPAGWAKLLSILANVKQFYEGASDAANAPISETPLATCIDFYGTNRVAKYPDNLTYVSPKGQTAFSPDPIGILKNPPNGELAQRFVDFVLSAKGQSLWFLPVGAQDGPVGHALRRQPIRRDVYEAHEGKILPRIFNPYVEGNSMSLDVEMKDARFGVLRNLVKVAAVDNVDGLKAARKKLIDTGFPADRMAKFNQLPPNVRTAEQIRQLAPLFTREGDKVQREKLLTEWKSYFARQWAEVAK